MNKKLVKSIFYTFFTGFILWSVYADAASSSSPQTVVTIGLIFVLLIAYVENKKLVKWLKVKNQTLEEMINTFSENCPDLIAYKNIKHRYITCNKAMCRAYRLKSFMSVKDKTTFELLPPKAAAIIMAHDSKVIETGKSIKYTIEIDHPSSGSKTYDVISAPTKKDGEVTGIMTIARDITIRERMRAKFIEKQKQVNDMMDNLPMVSFVTDKEGKYLRGNSKFLELMNLNHDELAGVNIAHTYTDAGTKTIDYENKVVIKEKRPLITEHLYKIAGREAAWYKEYRVPIINEHKRVIGITVFLLDIQKEKEASQQKERFIATLSHDLKTPAIAQVRSLEMLLDGMFGGLNEEQQEMLKLTLESCKNMYDMVSTVLFSYKFENEEIKLHCTDINIIELTAECCNDLAKYANEKNLEILIKPKSKIGQICADRTFIKRAIANILENSISYAFEKTKIEILIKNHNKNLEIQIISESPFIKKEALEMMFDKYRGQASYNKIGFCLKLHLAKQIVEAHNGVLIAESKKSDKNIFGFIIPSSVNSQTPLEKVML